MPAGTFPTDVQEAIRQRYREKYGDVQVSFDVLHPIDEHAMQVQFTLSDARGFITRYYGKATYRAGQLHLSVKSL